jgi:hypothetical protein
MPTLPPGTEEVGHAVSKAWQEAEVVVVSVVVPLELDSSAKVIALQLGMAPST